MKHIYIHKQLRLTRFNFIAAACAVFGLALFGNPGSAAAAKAGAGAAGPAVIGTALFPAGSGAGTTFPASQTDRPNLTMIPSNARNVANLDYNTGDFSQWGTTYGKCPPLTNFNIDRSTLRTPNSVASAHYMASGYCNPIEGSGGDSRRAEYSSHVQDEFVYEGNERWYYLAIRPAPDMPTPKYNYFLVTQWHPKGNGSPTLSVNFNAAGTVDIGEDHKLIMGPLRKGLWTDYVLHVKFSKYASKGWIEAWENGTKTVQKTPFAAMTDKTDFVKQGIYTSPKEGTVKHEVWHDGMTTWAP